MDLGTYLGHKRDQEVTPLWMICVLPMMGLILYPYSSIQVLLWSSEVVRGDRRDPSKTFMGDKFRLNLPGDLYYSTTLAWMSKVRGYTQELVAYFTTYADDYWVAAGSSAEAWRVA